MVALFSAATIIFVLLASSTTPQMKESQEVQNKETLSCNFRVESCWSQAGIATCFVLQQRLQEEGSKKKGMRIVLDLGCTPIFDKTIPSDIVILSHGHLDHFSGVFGHARAYGMIYNGTPTYYVPAELAPKLEKARDCLSDMDATCSDEDGINIKKRDKSLLQMNIVPVKAGEEIELKSRRKAKGNIKFYLRPFSVSHGGHPALGYVIASKTVTKGGLKEEYKGMDGRALGNLRKSGVEIAHVTTTEEIEVCYTGDSSVDGLVMPESCMEDVSGTLVEKLDHQFREQAFQAYLILCELTFLDKEDRLMAKERGHLNIMDIQTILESHGYDVAMEQGEQCNLSNGDKGIRKQLPENLKFIFYHVSLKHRPLDHMLTKIIESLPRTIAIRSQLAASSFINFESDPLGQIVNSNGCIHLNDYLDYKKRTEVGTTE